MSSLLASVLVWACILQLVSASMFSSKYDGLPRLAHWGKFPDAPTKAYGKLPLTYLSINQPADCDWYGFSNANYPVEVSELCLAYTLQTEALPKANTQELRPYYYYTCDNNYCWDDNWNQYYCMIGCFYLGNTTLSIPPITAVPTTPVAPGTSAPPGVTAPPGFTASQGHAFLPTPSVVMVAALCAGALAAVHLRIQW